VPAALGQGQVDRAGGSVALGPRVAAALVDGDLPAALREQDRQQAAGQAGADQGQGAGIVAVQAGGFLCIRARRGRRRRGARGGGAGPRGQAERQRSTSSTSASTSA